MATVVPRVLEESAGRASVTARGRLDVLDPGQGAPGPCEAAEEMASKLDGVQRAELFQKSLGRERPAGVEGDSEQVEPRFALGVAHLFERRRELDRELGTRAPGCSSERDEERKGTAGGDVDRYRILGSLSDRHRT